MRRNRDGGAEDLLVVTALHEALKVLLQYLEVPNRVLNVRLHFNGILVLELHL